MKYVAVEIWKSSDAILTIVGPFPTLDQVMTWCEWRNESNGVYKTTRWSARPILEPGRIPAPIHGKV